MNRKIILAAGLLTMLMAATADQSQAGDPYAQYQVWSHNFSMDRPWHSGYYAQQYGQPTAMVVPPGAHMRQTYSWGVSQNLMQPIHHQFGRSANSPGQAARGGFRSTPNWPNRSHTDQFGYNYVRGPW